MLMEGHFLKCRGKKRHRAWAPSQQHQPRALCALSMRCWNDAPRADASRLRAVQPFQQTLSYGVKMALRVDPFQKRHQSVGCPVVLPLPVHAKVGQYGAGRPAETRNVGAGLGGLELPCCYTKSIGIICSPLCDAIQHRNELMIAHQCESIIGDPGTQDGDGSLAEIRVFETCMRKSQYRQPHVYGPLHAVAMARSLGMMDFCWRLQDRGFI